MNFVIQFGPSIKAAVPSGKQAAPLFKKCLNYVIIIIIIINTTITISAVAHSGFCLHLQLSFSPHTSEVVV